MLAVIGLLNLGAVGVICALTMSDPFWAALAGLIHVALVPGALLAILCCRARTSTSRSGWSSRLGWRCSCSWSAG